jgi:hypothetical protein
MLMILPAVWAPTMLADLRCRLVGCHLECDWVRELAAIARNGDGEAVTAGYSGPEVSMSRR